MNMLHAPKCSLSLAAGGRSVLGISPQWLKMRRLPLRGGTHLQLRNEYRQFDFWIWHTGERDLRGGQPAGRNTIETDLKRCALSRSWSSVDGSRGREHQLLRPREAPMAPDLELTIVGGALELDGWTRKR